jgi:hypothetical protein
MEMDHEDFKLNDPLLSLLASVKNEEVLQKIAKGAKVGLTCSEIRRVFAFFASFCEK